MGGREAVPGLPVAEMSHRTPAEAPNRSASGATAAAHREAGAAGPSDESLVSRAQSGDRAALRQLIERHQRRIYQLALSIVKDHEEALDVVQDTFVKVHQHLPTFKGDAAFFTWTYRIAYNLSIDALRKSGRGEKVEVEESTLTDEGSHYDPYGATSASPQKAALRGELSAQLQRALATLSENHRAILVLREVDGLSYEELSEALNIPKGTVMSRLFHARQKMQEAMKGYVGDDAETGGRES
jgi:RNA polymerase sigma-70 factor (ECF subfamily)